MSSIAPGPSQDRPSSFSLDGLPQKRRRGVAPKSCAECRRLKLRCEKEPWPCAQCQRRGCGAICPEGVLASGQGNRMVLATTEDLHNRIQMLAYRVRSLEDALRDSHAKHSTELHALLKDDLLALKAPIEGTGTPKSTQASSSDVKKEEEGLVSAMGSLSVSSSGRVNYWGQSAGASYFMENEEFESIPKPPQPVTGRELVHPYLLVGMSGFEVSLSLGITEDYGPQRLQLLLQHLPQHEVALYLKDVYFRFADTPYTVLSHEDFYQICEEVYNQDQEPSADDFQLMQKISVLFSIFSCACLVDPAQPPYNAEAEKYHHLACAALLLGRPVEHANVNAIQAVFLLVLYRSQSDRYKTNTESTRWVLFGIALKLAQAIGLHRDGEEFGFTPQESESSRRLFSELCCFDAVMAVSYGRPPFMSPVHVSTAAPFEKIKSPEHIYHSFSHRLVTECVRPCLYEAYIASPPSYTTIMRLDRLLRAFPVPSIFTAPAGALAPDRAALVNGMDPVKFKYHRYLCLVMKEYLLVYLHRNFFAKAIKDHPEDPFASQFGTSVLAVYRSASTVVSLTQRYHSELPHPSSRQWFVWAQLFSNTIVLGAIVTRCPSQTMAPAALAQIEVACDIFALNAPTFAAEKMLNILQALRSRARQTLSDFRAQMTKPPSARSPPMKEEEDELAALGGETRINVQPKDSPQARHRTPPDWQSSKEWHPLADYPYVDPSTMHQSPSVDPSGVAYASTPPQTLPLSPLSQQGEPYANYGGMYPDMSQAHYASMPQNSLHQAIPSPSVGGDSPSSNAPTGVTMGKASWDAFFSYEIAHSSN